MSDQNQDKLIGKLRRMLALAENNPNPNEAASASQRAHRLMLEHNLSFAELGDRPVGLEGFKQADLSIFLGKMEPKEAPLIAALLDKHFLVKVVFEHADLIPEEGLGRKKRLGVTLEFYGKRHNAEIAHHFYKFLSRVYRELFREMVQKAVEKQRFTATNARRKAVRAYERFRAPYYEGLTLGIDHALQAQTESVRGEWGLVPVDLELIQAFEDSDIPEREETKEQAERKESDIDALVLGYGAAEKVALNTPLAQHPVADQQELEQHRLNKLLHLQRGGR